MVVGLDICGEDVAELGPCCAATSPLSVLATTGAGANAGSGAGSVCGVVGIDIPTDSLDGCRGDRSPAPEPELAAPEATSCKEENVGFSVDGMRCPAPEFLLELDGTPNCPRSLSIGGPKEVFLATGVVAFVFALGLKNIPVGCPGGLEISRPDDGVEPNCTAPAPRCTASSEEKYSLPLEPVCDMPSGEGGGNPAAARSSNISFVVERFERSELLRALGGRLFPAGERFVE